MRISGEDSRRSRVDAEAGPDMDRLMQEEDGAIDRALRQAVRDALLHHKKLGQSVIVSQNGKLTKLLPDQIQIN